MSEIEELRRALELAIAQASRAAEMTRVTEASQERLVEAIAIERRLEEAEDRLEDAQDRVSRQEQALEQANKQLTEARNSLAEARYRHELAQWQLDSLRNRRWYRFAAALRRPSPVRLARALRSVERPQKPVRGTQKAGPAAVQVPSRPKTTAKAADEKSGDEPQYTMPGGYAVRPYLAVAAVLGRRSQAMFRYEWRQISGFPPNKWRAVLEADRPHLLVVEEEPEGSRWAEQIGEEPGPDLAAMLSWCREHGIRTVLWGDGPAAKHFDHAFKPRKPYIQPRIHNPVPLTGGRTLDNAAVPALGASYAKLLEDYRRPKIVIGEPDEQTRLELLACLTPVAPSIPAADRQGDPFFEMRRVHAEHALTAQVDEMLEAAGMPSVRSPLSVSAMVAVSGPDRFEHVLEQLRGQRRRPGQLVVVARDGWVPAEIPDGFHDVTVIPSATTEPLGAAMHRGADACDGDLIARIHEEDLYGPDYLDDLVRTFTYTEAEVTGKACHYLHAAGATLLRENGREHLYTDRVARGSLLARRHVVRDLGFGDVSDDPEGLFLRRCAAEGVRVWSADRYSYVCVRSEVSDHDGPLFADAEIVGYDPAPRLPGG